MPNGNSARQRDADNPVQEHIGFVSPACALLKAELNSFSFESD
jgi:hypothetical protein